MTTAAMKQFDMFTDICIDIVNMFNRAVDGGASYGWLPLIPKPSFDVSENHGDGGYIRKTMRNNKGRITDLSKWDCDTLVCGGDAGVRGKLRLLAQYLHGLQDLYSHSQYVERHGGYDPDDPDGKNRLPGFEDDVTNPDDVPLWDMDPDLPENDDETGMQATYSGPQAYLNYMRDVRRRNPPMVYYSGLYFREQALMTESEVYVGMHDYMAKDGPGKLRGRMVNGAGVSNFAIAENLAARHTKVALAHFVAGMPECAKNIIASCCKEWQKAFEERRKRWSSPR